MLLTRKRIGWFLFWIAASALSSGLFLFQVPGFHYDEAWIASLASQIAFQKGFWPVFGMNHYTVPIMSYLLACGFRIVGYPSLELARLIYWVMNLISFSLFYLWLEKRNTERSSGGLESASGIFALLWVTLPLSIFNQRIFLEVTTGYAFFGAIALWGLSEAFEEEKTGGLLLGLLAIALGAASHILFLGAVWAAIWACWKEAPEMLERPCVKWAITWTLTPMLALLLAVFLSPIGGGEMAKVALVAVATLMVLVGLWRRWWKTGLSENLLHISSWILAPFAVAGMFFFFLFEISGVWPISQTTGNVNSLALVPGFAVGGILLYAILRPGERSQLFLFFRAFWLVTCALTVISIYKPTSARYWELATVTFLITGALAISEMQSRGQKYWKGLLSGLIAASSLNLVVLSQSYFVTTLLHGATAESYHWLWVHDTSADYRPVVRAYEGLRTTRGFCAQDVTEVDEGRNAFVLQVYRKFAQLQEAEKPCETDHDTEHYKIGIDPAVEPVPGLGDLHVSRAEIQPKIQFKARMDAKNHAQ